jgi:hypothetical protein
MGPTPISASPHQRRSRKGPKSALASLYNTLRLSGNGCLFFLLIVAMSGKGRAWKTGQFSEIPRINLIGQARMEFTWVPVLKGDLSGAEIRFTGGDEKERVY